MEPEEIKERIKELQKKHDATGGELDDVPFFELYEANAEDLIIDYCESKEYQINGFPTDKRKIGGEEYDEDYFTRDRFQLYLDLLTIEKEDVADLTWFYVHNFWPEAFEDKEHYLRTIKHDLEHNREVMYPDEL